jgi:DMSO/TMAO reductase YedYZ molybdopterin-dependent catalytic subunit
MASMGRSWVWCLLLAPALWGFGGCANESAGGERVALEKARQDSVEIKEYDGERLDTFFREYDNSIKGPQKVDIASYHLEIRGLVEKPRSLTYEGVLALPPVRRAITLYCVEGWKEHLLFDGVRVKDVLALAGPAAGVTTIIFHGVDGYSTALPYADVGRLDLMLASRINGLVLDEARGFPFQLVAQSKLGYKWIKWVNAIELSDQPYIGFWEKRGYSDQADVPEEWLEEK